MIFAYIDLLTSSPLAFIVFFGAIFTALVGGICFHECSHAIIADSLGDSTPRRMGRISLNPRAHLDPIGTIMIFIAGFGWGKPVEVNILSLKNGPKAGMASVAAAGPISNFIIGIIAAIPIQIGVIEWIPPSSSAIDNFVIHGSWSITEYFGLYLSAIVLISIILGVFNLVPLFPLDGHRILPIFLPDRLAESYMEAQTRYGFILLIALIVLPMLLGGDFGFLYDITSPIINGLLGLFTGFDTKFWA